MNPFDSLLQSDGDYLVNDFGESIAYTARIAGVDQTPVTITGVVDRLPPDLMPEGGKQRVRKVSVFIAASATTGLATRPNRGDGLSLPWQIGETASTFRVTGIDAQDAGGWQITAEQSIG